VRSARGVLTPIAAGTARESTPELFRRRAEGAYEDAPADGADGADGAVVAAAKQAPLQAINGDRTCVHAPRGSVYAPFIPPAKAPVGGRGSTAPDAAPRKTPVERAAERAVRNNGAARAKAPKERRPPTERLAALAPPLNDFERQREENIARNAAMVAGLGIAPLVPPEAGARKRKATAKN
jgi:hypothetical protein